ncbi:hypothetical protein IPZ70_15150 [Streptomyces polychromogenes]|nr:hypothetical protein [Streptomyces polychromogenes]
MPFTCLSGPGSWRGPVTGNQDVGGPRLRGRPPRRHGVVRRPRRRQGRGRRSRRERTGQCGRQPGRYVSNLSSDDVPVIDASTDGVRDTVPAGDGPTGVAASPRAAGPALVGELAGVRVGLARLGVAALLPAALRLAPVHEAEVAGVPEGDADGAHVELVGAHPQQELGHAVRVHREGLGGVPPDDEDRPAVRVGVGGEPAEDVGAGGDPPGDDRLRVHVEGGPAAPGLPGLPGVGGLLGHLGRVPLESGLREGEQDPGLAVDRTGAETAHERDEVGGETGAPGGLGRLPVDVLVGAVRRRHDLLQRLDPRVLRHARRSPDTPPQPPQPTARGPP